MSQSAKKNSSASILLNRLPMLNLNSDVETLRRVGFHQYEINTTFTNEIQELPESARNCDLMRFLKWQEVEKLKNNNMFKWIYFNVGCLNARLYYLIGDHTQLTDYYENCQNWLKKQDNLYLSIAYQNLHLLITQHYANYLHATQKYESAQHLVERALKRCEEVKSNVDVAYQINFMLQLQNIKNAIQQQAKEKQTLRRALKFNLSPTETLVAKVGKTQSDRKVIDKTKTPNQKELAFTIYTGEEQQLTQHKRKIKEKNSQKISTTTKATIKRALYTPTLSSGSGSSSDSTEQLKTPDSASSLEFSDDKNDCKIIELKTSGVKEVTVDLNACQFIELDTSEEINESPEIIVKETKKIPRKAKDTKTIEKELKKLDLTENKLVKSCALKQQPKTIEKLTTDGTSSPVNSRKTHVNRVNTKTEAQTNKTRGRPRKINKLADDENIQPIATLKTTITSTTTTRRRKVN